MNRPLRSGVSLPVLVAAMALLGSAATLDAQDTALRKSDVVRLLTGSTYSVAEVATIVRTNCLSFTPTDRDYDDFTNLGADAGVISAIRECAGEAPPAVPEADQAPVVPAIVAEPVADTVIAAAGTEAVVTFLIRSGGSPVEGARAVLRGEAAGGETPPQWVSATGSDGRVSFRVPAGTAPAASTLRIATPGVPLAGRTSVVLVTTEAGPAALFKPTEAVAVGLDDAVLDLGVADAFGNPVPAAEITVERASDGREVGRGTTAGDGTLRLTAPAVLVAGESALTVRSAASVIGSVGLQPDERPAALRFVSGAGQVALPERRLAEPVVVEVTDADGGPVVATLVVFEVTNGVPDEPSGRTGDDGRATLRLMAGSDDDSPVAITATAGTVESSLDIDIRSRAELVSEALSRGDRFLAARNYGGAVVEYAEALELDPEVIDAWIGLGRARGAAGEREEARFAFEQALLIDPRNAVALQGSEDYAPRRTVFALDVWGGKTDDNGRDAGIRNAEARIYPTPHTIVHLTFDNALNFRHPYLTRGDADLKGYFGGVGLRWGVEQQLTTSFEFGKRESPPVALGDIGTNQNSFTLTQDVEFAGGSGVSFGGWYGRWFDQDDWSFFAEGRFASGPGFMVIPSVSYGDHAGSNVVGLLEETRRAKEKESRGGIRVRYQSPSGWGVEPGLAVGSVTSETTEFEGSLFDAMARLWVPLGRQARLQGYVRRQSPPGTSSFWTVALGLGFSVQER